MPSGFGDYRAPPPLLLPEMKTKVKVKQERDLKSVQVLTASLSSPVHASDSPSVVARRKGGFTRSLINNLVTYSKSFYQKNDY